MANPFERDQSGKRSASLREQYTQRRLFDADATIITDAQYNLTIGLTVAVGFIIDFFMAFYMKDLILSIPVAGILIGYFLMGMGGAYVVHKSTSAFVSALGFLVLAAGMGLILTYFLNAYELSSVYMAFGITAGITVVITAVAAIAPRFFLSLGSALAVSLVVTLVAEVLCSFLFPGVLRFTDYAIVLIFCGYVGYDWARAQQYPKTLDNAIDSAADLYVDIVNIMIRVLEITGKAKD